MKFHLRTFSAVGAMQGCMAMDVENQLWNRHINKLMNFKKLKQISNYGNPETANPETQAKETQNCRMLKKGVDRTSRVQGKKVS